MEHCGTDGSVPEKALFHAGLRLMEHWNTSFLIKRIGVKKEGDRGCRTPAGGGVALRQEVGAKNVFHVFQCSTQAPPFAKGFKFKNLKTLERCASVDPQQSAPQPGTPAGELPRLR